MAATALRSPELLHDRPWARGLLVVIAMVGIVLGALSWALASAPGSSPDDDYHLTSSWCTPPIEESGCPWTDIEKPTRVEVPDPVGRASECYRFKPDISAGCILDYQYSNTVLTSRYDSGEYPGGFYHFANRLIGDDFNETVVRMRIVNALLGLAGVFAAAALAPSALRRNIIFAAACSWVPMGFYLMASNNPSSWAISGVFCYGAAMTAAGRARGWRLPALLGVAAYGALLACASRSDSAVYVIVVSVAVWIFNPIGRRNLIAVLTSIAASLAGLLTFLRAGQKGILDTDAYEPVLGFNQLLFHNVVQLPDYLAGFFGLHWGPGWFDIHLYSVTTITMIMLAGAVLMAGLGQIYWRKSLAMLVVGGVMLGLPVTLMVRQGLYLHQNQPRYLLPLLAVFILLTLARREGRAMMVSRTQLGVGAALIALANSGALHATIRRYTTGQDVVGLGLHFDVEWWWAFGPQPMQLWVGGSLAFLVGLAALAALIHRRVPVPQPIS